MRLSVFFFCLFVSITIGLVNAQNELMNHKKYWYYKSRLNNDFIKTGIDSGESIPLNERRYYGHATSYDVNSIILKAGDGGTRQGIYLSVLATEYKLLKDNNRDLTEVKHEIFCALNAVNRIDYFAEPLRNPSFSPSSNGFFVRDDIPGYFVKKNYRHFNYYYDDNNLTSSGYPANAPQNDFGFTQMDLGLGIGKGIDITESDGSDPSGVARMSQDQVYYLLMGLTLVNKLVDANATDGSNAFGFGSSGTLLAEQASKIAERIINYIKSDALWRIKDPIRP
ncbi:MAG TPA: hypothetical protein PLQ93_07530 [Bacteroidia bacterium]|nr:hypothetical protein [Bacteroidia bacterium]